LTFYGDPEMESNTLRIRNYTGTCEPPSACKFDFEWIDEVTGTNRQEHYEGWFDNTTFSFVIRSATSGRQLQLGPITETCVWGACEKLMPTGSTSRFPGCCGSRAFCCTSETTYNFYLKQCFCGEAGEFTSSCVDDDAGTPD
jgi:hypothetical protein